MKKETWIKKTLDNLYPDPKIPLRCESHYTLLVAVLLSAQCTDARVNAVTPLLFARAKTPKAMLNLLIVEIERIIKPCGLHKTKAKAIWNLSKKLIEEFDGTVPNTLKELESLPGVGHKTASCIMIEAFNTPAFPVDTHIHRLAKRWGLSSGKNVLETEKDLMKRFLKKDWHKLHLQMIYYGRQYCPAKNHTLTSCPICLEISRRECESAQEAGSALPMDSPM